MINDESIQFDAADILAELSVAPIEERGDSHPEREREQDGAPSDLLNDWLSHGNDQSQNILYEQLLKQRSELSLNDSIAQPVGGQRSLLLSGMKHEKLTLTTTSS